MTSGSTSTTSINPDPEVKRTFRRLCQINLNETGSVEIRVEVDQHIEMAGNHPQSISDFTRPNLEGVSSSIVRPLVAANNFELKQNFIQLVQQMCQFDRFQDEDPYEPLRNLLEICDIYRLSNAYEKAIRRRLSPFTLRGRAKKWLNSFLPRSLTT